MANCHHCAAPLTANTNICPYCGVRNDVDLRDKHQYILADSDSQRQCPHCQQNLQTIQLNTTPSLTIERCQSCFGLFFDQGEIEILLENSVNQTSEINTQLMDNINQERYQGKAHFSYIKCPVCQQLMDRINFGQRSGVVVDKCHQHGIWLDSGEITHLMEWTKAGGQLLQQPVKKAKQLPPLENTPLSRVASNSRYNNYSDNATGELIDIVSLLIFRLFR